MLSKLPDRKPLQCQRVHYRYSGGFRVGRHSGLLLDQDQLARAHPFAGNEPSTARLLRMIESTGLTARVVHIKLGELITLSQCVPAIVRLPNGKSLLFEAVQERDGDCFALVNDLETGPGVSANRR